MARKPEWMQDPKCTAAHDILVFKTGFKFPRASWDIDVFTLHEAVKEIGGRAYACSGHIYRPENDVVAPNCDLVLRFEIDYMEDMEYKRIHSRSKSWTSDKQIAVAHNLGIFGEPDAKMVIGFPVRHPKTHVKFKGTDPLSLVEQMQTLVGKVNEMYAPPEK